MADQDTELLNALLAMEETPAPEAEPSGLWEGVKQFGSGVVEGLAGDVGFIADYNPFNPNAAIYGGPSVSDALFRTVEPITAEPSDDYRYLRTIGQFVGPTGAIGGAAKVLKAAGKAPGAVRALGLFSSPAAMGTDVTAAVGAQTAQDIAPQSGVAPVIGALFGGAAPSGAKQLLGSVGDVFAGASRGKLEQIAGKVLREQTNLTAEQIENSLKSLPDDELKQFATTAEVTGDAGMAQIQQVAAREGKQADEFNVRTVERQKTREKMLDELSQTAAISREGLGTKMAESATSLRDKMKDIETQLWQTIPRWTDINVSPGQKKVKAIAKRKQAGDPLHTVTKRYMDQFANSKDFGSVRTSGQLQDMRGNILQHLRENPQLQNYDREILSTIANEIDGAMAKGLKGDDYELWKAARDQTRDIHDRFGGKTAGAKMVMPGGVPDTLLGRAFRGDRAAVREIKTAINSDPKLLEDIKRGVLDMAAGADYRQLTPARMRKFISSNESGLEELFGPEGLERFKRVAEDLTIEADTISNAFKASKGQSITSQANTVAAVVYSSASGHLWRLSPSAAMGVQAANRVYRLLRQSTDKDVMQILFRAAMDPELAADLLKKPTPKNIMSTIERLERFSSAAGRSVGKGLAFSDTEATERDMADEELLQTLLQMEGQNEEPNASPSLFGGPSELANEFQKKSFDLGGDMQRPFQDIVMGASETYGLSPQLLNAVIEQESNFDPQAKSGVGAQGLMQLMPATAREVASRIGLDPESIDLTDPNTNIALGAAYLKQLLDMYDGDEGLALTAYHSGMGNVNKALQKTGGSSLEDIVPELGPVGQKYALQVLGRMNA